MTSFFWTLGMYQNCSEIELLFFQLGVDPGRILTFFETKFIPKKLMVTLSSVIKDKKIDIETGAKITKSRSKKNDDEDDDNATPDKAMDQIEKGKKSLSFT